MGPSLHASVGKVIPKENHILYNAREVRGRLFHLEQDWGSREELGITILSWCCSLVLKLSTTISFQLSLGIKERFYETLSYEFFSLSIRSIVLWQNNFGVPKYFSSSKEIRFECLPKRKKCNTNTEHSKLFYLGGVKEMSILQVM